MRNYGGSRTATYTSFKGDHIFESYLSDMANSQLRKTLSRFRCGSHWLRCATRFMTQNHSEQSCPVSLKGRICGKPETEHHAVFQCDAYYHIRRSQKFQKLFANVRQQNLHAFYKSNDSTLIAKFLLRCRRERTNIVRYHDIDVRT